MPTNVQKIEPNNVSYEVDGKIIVVGIYTITDQIAFHQYYIDKESEVEFHTEQRDFYQYIKDEYDKIS